MVRDSNRSRAVGHLEAVLLGLGLCVLDDPAEQKAASANTEVSISLDSQKLQGQMKPSLRRNVHIRR